MATANQILRRISDDELRQAASEALEWSRTGVLTGDALRCVAERLQAEAGLAEDGVLRDTDTLVCREAARRFVGLDDGVGAGDDVPEGVGGAVDALQRAIAREDLHAVASAAGATFDGDTVRFDGFAFDDFVSRLLVHQHTIALAFMREQHDMSPRASVSLAAVFAHLAARLGTEN